jgi:hypothetical protein
MGAAVKAVKLNRVGGRLVSARSKTGNPACSAAMSAWVRSRHGGPAVVGEVFKVLAKCRAQARQNKRAALQQQSGKLAEGRGTWQRSEQAGALVAARAARQAAAAPKAAAAPPARPTFDARYARVMAKLDRREVGGNRRVNELEAAKDRAETWSELRRLNTGISKADSSATRAAITRRKVMKIKGARELEAENAAARAAAVPKPAAAPPRADQVDRQALRWLTATPHGDVNFKAQLRRADAPTLKAALEANTGRAGRKGAEQKIRARLKELGEPGPAAPAPAPKPAAAVPGLRPVSADERADVVRTLGALRAAKADYKGTYGAAGRYRAEQHVRPHVRAAAAELKGYVKAGREHGIDVAGAIREAGGFPRELTRAKPARLYHPRAGERAAAIVARARAATATAAAPAAAPKPKPVVNKPARGSREERLGRLVSLAGGRARHEQGRLDVKARDAQLERKARLQAALDRLKPAGPTGGGFALRNGPQSRLFGSSGGKTGALFDEMKGAAGRDLPGQTNFLGRPAVKSLREQAAAHRAAKGASTWRARELLGRAQKRYQAARAKATAAKRAGDLDKAHRHADAAGRHATRMERIAPHAVPKAAPPASMADAIRAAAKPGAEPGAVLKAAQEARAIERADRRESGGVAAEGHKALASYRAREASRAKAAKRLREARSSTVREVPTRAVAFDPERFQYKLAVHGEHGVGEALHGVKKWDPELAGVLQVWRDPANGKTYVVNGHHRLDLANRLGAGKVAVRYIKARDAEEARAKGAITNIAEGRGTSTDAGQFFRDTGLTKADLENRGVPMRERIATEGLALSDLEEGLWRKHKGGELTAARGAIIGGSGLNHAQQATIAKHAGKGGVQNLTDRDLKEFIDNAREAPTIKQRSIDLFGGSDEDINLGAHRARAQGFIKERLGREKRVFGTVAKSKNAADLERAGNRIDAEGSGKVAQAAAENLHIFDTLKNRRGPVSDLLNEAAERAHAGENARKVHEDVYRRLPAAISEMLGGG